MNDGDAGAYGEPRRSLRLGDGSNHAESQASAETATAGRFCQPFADTGSRQTSDVRHLPCPTPRRSRHRSELGVGFARRYGSTEGVVINLGRLVLHVYGNGDFGKTSVVCGGTEDQGTLTAALGVDSFRRGKLCIARVVVDVAIATVGARDAGYHFEASAGTYAWASTYWW